MVEVQLFTIVKQNIAIINRKIVISLPPENFGQIPFEKSFLPWLSGSSAICTKELQY